MRRWRAAIEPGLAALRGVKLEDKVFSVAVHYRAARDKQGARDAIWKAAAALGTIRIIGGKQVVNILPAGALDKGVALGREFERLGCDAAVYVGDDETDEDVFARDEPETLLGIHVGRSQASLASYYLERQSEIDQLLRLLISMRPALAHARS